ncbi:hypothetical protein [Bacillus sp. V3B]|uniref:hypothetical protein n=1 Tax=Bacillus sp. V3B TaxID=2804915 RepID=UPI0028124A58|nr:hypothetical protein [Bacillus sp. V3B]
MNVDGGTYEILRASIIKLSHTMIEIEDYEDTALKKRLKKEALLELEEKWLRQLQPYGEQGYNLKKHL